MLLKSMINAGYPISFNDIIFCRYKFKQVILTLYDCKQIVDDYRMRLSNTGHFCFALKSYKINKYTNHKMWYEY